MTVDVGERQPLTGRMDSKDFANDDQVRACYVSVEHPAAKHSNRRGQNRKIASVGQKIDAVEALRILKKSPSCKAIGDGSGPIIQHVDTENAIFPDAARYA